LSDFPPVGRPHLHFRSCDSTNEIARGLAAAGSGTGTLVTSDEQTAGRGRQGRPWTTPPGALAYSVVLRGPVEIPSTVPLRAGVAVCEAVESLGADRAMVKWPNDIWIEGRKCAGILVEGRPQDGWAVIGIGLNVDVASEDFDPEFRDRVTSVFGDRAPVVSPGRGLTEATGALNASLEKWLDAPVDDVLAELGSRNALEGREISWQGGSGIAAGIGDTGDLHVNLADGTIINLDAGEVHLNV